MNVHCAHRGLEILLNDDGLGTLSTLNCVCTIAKAFIHVEMPGVLDIALAAIMEELKRGLSESTE